MEFNRKQKFSIRKYAIGVASVLIGTVIIGTHVNADTNSLNDNIKNIVKSSDKAEGNELQSSDIGTTKVEESESKLEVKKEETNSDTKTTEVSKKETTEVSDDVENDSINNIVKSSDKAEGNKLQSLDEKTPKVEESESKLEEKKEETNSDTKTTELSTKEATDASDDVEKTTISEVSNDQKSLNDVAEVNSLKDNLDSVINESEAFSGILSKVYSKGTRKDEAPLSDEVKEEINNSITNINLAIADAKVVFDKDDLNQFEVDTHISNLNNQIEAAYVLLKKNGYDEISYQLITEAETSNLIKIDDKFYATAKLTNQNNFTYTIYAIDGKLKEGDELKLEFTEVFGGTLNAIAKNIYASDGKTVIAELVDGKAMPDPDYLYDGKIAKDAQRTKATDLKTKESQDIQAKGSKYNVVYRFTKAAENKSNVSFGYTGAKAGGDFPTVSKDIDIVRSIKANGKVLDKITDKVKAYKFTESTETVNGGIKGNISLDKNSDIITIYKDSHGNQMGILPDGTKLYYGIDTRDNKSPFIKFVSKDGKVSYRDQYFDEVNSNSGKEYDSSYYKETKNPFDENSSKLISPNTNEFSMNTGINTIKEGSTFTIKLPNNDMTKFYKIDESSEFPVVSITNVGQGDDAISPVANKNNVYLWPDTKNVSNAKLQVVSLTDDTLVIKVIEGELLPHTEIFRKNLDDFGVKREVTEKIFNFAKFDYKTKKFEKNVGSSVDKSQLAQLTVKDSENNIIATKDTSNYWKLDYPKPNPNISSAQDGALSLKFVNESGETIVESAVVVPSGTDGKDKYDIVSPEKIEVSELTEKNLGINSDKKISIENKKLENEETNSTTSTPPYFIKGLDKKYYIFKKFASEGEKYTYDSKEYTASKQDGILKKDPQSVVAVYEELKYGNVVIKYVKESNPSENLKEETQTTEHNAKPSITNIVGQSYDTSNYKIPETLTDSEGVKYILDKTSQNTPTNIRGTLTEDKIEVVYKYVINSGDVIVRFEDEEGNEIKSSEIISSHEKLGTKYSTVSKKEESITSSKDNKKYVLTEKPVKTGSASETGVVTKEAQVVTYVYKLPTPTATPETSEGKQGETQTGKVEFTPGSNNVPMDDNTPATFEDGSAKKVVSGEGTYTVEKDGTVTFTPENTFVGTAKGVTVVRQDTNGTKASSTYTPTVTPTQAPVIANYYKYGTTDKLADSDDQGNKDIDSNYTTTAKTIEPKVETIDSPEKTVTRTTTYTLKETPSNANGNVPVGGAVVNYYYVEKVTETVTPKQATVVANYYKDGTTDKLADSDDQGQKDIDSNYTTTAKTIEPKVETIDSPE
ncbi:MAG: YSIRK-type signal peptide-containing protein, partial [Streptococcus sp.]|nr:YSIRK-type signal peptide-containing protein [Streptococcus sp.]